MCRRILFFSSCLNKVCVCFHFPRRPVSLLAIEWRLWYNRGMSAAINTNAFDRATEPVLGILSTDQVHKIVDYHADESLQARLEELAQKANEGELTEDERSEYEGYAQANKFVAVLQAQARRRLASQTDV